MSNLLNLELVMFYIVIQPNFPSKLLEVTYLVSFAVTFKFNAIDSSNLPVFSIESTNDLT